MKTYVADSLADIYRAIYYDIFDAPELSPRGLKTKELIAPQIMITNPKNRIAYHPDRKFSTKYALVESLLIFDETNELKYFERFNKNIAKFSDDGETLFGAYGYRIAENIPRLINKLITDSDTRQAVLPILRVEDAYKRTKDVPCTISVQFLLREGQLNMITNMRSNDIILGLPYDVFVFTTLQEIIANTLGVKLGWYLHRPGSLHLYENNYSLFKSIGKRFGNVSVEIPCTIDEWYAVKNNYKNFVNEENSGSVFKIFDMYINHNISMAIGGDEGGS